jgi:hypothetical protein
MGRPWRAIASIASSTMLIVALCFATSTGAAQADPISPAACLGSHDSHQDIGGRARATVDWGICSGGAAFVNVDLADTSCDDRSVETEYLLKDTSGTVIDTGWFRNGNGCGTVTPWDRSYSYSGSLVSLRIWVRACNWTGCTTPSGQTFYW